MTSQLSLPHDLFHSHIIPDLLSEHLHVLLVESEPPKWHAFHTLPLVSSAFRQTCQSLRMALFGVESHDDTSVISDILTFAQTLWAQAKLPPEQAESLSIPLFTYPELMSSGSVLRIYTCIALSRSYLNHDVLWHLVPERSTPSFGGDHNAPETDANLGVVSLSRSPQRLGMRDDKMHRLYLPLTCAATLCDSVKPERLAYIVADYLAEIIPTYSTIPVMLKYAQDLQSYVDRKHRIDLQTWIGWTIQTLGLIERREELLIEIQKMGTLVHSFTRSSSIPQEVVQATNITKALGEVMLADWGMYSEEICRRVSTLLHHLVA